MIITPNIRDKDMDKLILQKSMASYIKKFT